MGISSNTQSIDSIIRSIPGAYTQIDQSQGGVSINIRGMTGLGRVNTTIDGVTQSFFSTSADDGGVHGNIGTSSFNAPVDKNFLIRVDVQRGVVNSGSGNALMGSANFKTIGIEDVVKKGDFVGFLGKYSYGSNAVGPSFMGAFAGQYGFENGLNLGFLFAYSGQNISQDYKTGGGERISEEKPYEDKTLSAPIKPDTLFNKPRSKMFKFGVQKSSFESLFAYRDYRNNLAGRRIINENYQINSRFNPTSEFIDLKLLFAYNRGLQIYNNGSNWGYHDMSGVKTKNEAISFDISNSTLKEWGQNQILSFTYGLNLFNNLYAHDFPEDRILLPYILTAFYPKGEQEFHSLYLNSNYHFNIFTMSANVNLTNSILSGNKGECSEFNELCQPKTSTKLNKSFSHLNYSFILSADLNPLFNPFISYARTHRIPNVQEFFFTHDADITHNINTFLKPELADTYQIGFNALTHGLLASDDFLGFKILYYDTRVKNYIYNRMYMQKADSAMFLMQLNDTQIAKFNGVELEFNYDADFFYSVFSYAYQKAKHKFSDSEALEFGGAQYGQSQFAKLPEHYANLDFGVRAFEGKVIVGAILKYTSKATRIAPEGSLDDDVNNPDALALLKTDNDLPQIPTIVDLYANLKLFKSLNIKAEVQNLFDKNYMDALYTYNSGSSTQNVGTWTEPVFIFNNSARGRTFILSLELRY